jgi:hypothetical protein
MRLVIHIFCVLLLAGCSEKEWLDIQMPVDALNQYQGYSSTQYSRQTSYIHEKTYPDESVILDIRDVINSGWEQCTYGGDDWQDFEDLSGEMPRHLYQRIKTWRTPDKRRLLFVSLHYETGSCENRKCEPEDNKQHVAIVEHNLPWWLFWESFDGLCNG